MFLTTILCGLFPVPTVYRPFQWILLVTSWQVALGLCIREEMEARDEVTHVASLMKGGDITHTPYFTGHTTCLLSDVLVIHMLTVNVKTCHFSAAGVFLSAQRLAVRAVHLLYLHISCGLCTVFSGHLWNS